MSWLGPRRRRLHRPTRVLLYVMDALRNGDHHAVKRIVSQNPKVTSMKGAGGSTPLMFATLYGNVDDVRFLLGRGADPNVKNDAGAMRSCGRSPTSRRRGCCWSMEPIPMRGPRLAERPGHCGGAAWCRAQLSCCSWIIAPVWWCQPTSTPSACRYRPQHTPPMTPSFGCSSIVAPIEIVSSHGLAVCHAVGLCQMRGGLDRLSPGAELFNLALVVLVLGMP